MWRDLLRSGLVVALGILLGRLAGFARELLLAHTLGLGRPADLAVFSMTLPDVLTSLLVGGAMGAALVPEFKTLQPQGRARGLFVQATLWTLVVFALLAGGVAWAGAAVVSVLAPGFPPEDFPLATRLLRASVAAVPFTAAAAVSSAYLNARGRFAVPALGTLLFNGVIIGAILGWAGPDQLLPLALGVAVAAVLRWGSQLGNAGLLPRVPEGPAGGTVTRALVLRYVQALASLGFVVLVPVVARALGSLHESGSVATLNYVHKLVELPMGMAVSVLSVVLLPKFAELFAQGRDAEALDLARQGSWLVWAIALPLCLAMAWFSGPLAALLFGHGRMGPEGARRIGELSTWALLSLPAMGQTVLFFAILSARGDTGRPFRWGTGIFLGYAVLAWEGQRRLGLTGLIGAGVLFHWAMAAAYSWILARHHRFSLMTGLLARDLAVATLAAAAALAPFVLLAGRSQSPLQGSLLAAAAGSASLGALLLPRYKTLPRGLRTFYKERT